MRIHWHEVKPLNLNTRAARTLAFLIAGAVQFAFILLTDYVGLSSLLPMLSLSVFIVHLALALLAGWLLVAVQDVAGRLNRWLMGALYGVLVWPLMASAAQNAAAFSPGWQSGQNLIVSSSSYVMLGLILSLGAAYTPKSVV